MATPHTDGSTQIGMQVDVGEAIDRSSIGRFHWLVVALCGLVFLFDGFDLQVIAFVAPAIAEAFHQPLPAFGPIFAAGLVGTMLGALVMGPLADRFGRRKMVIGSTALFGIFTLCTPFLSTMTELAAVRFLTGLGLGGAMPNIIALTAEYMPRRRRAMMVTIMSCGFAAGGLVGGLVGASIIPAWGWEGMFYIGAALPLAHALILLALLPESVRFLVERGGQKKQVARLLSRVTGRDYQQGSSFVVSEPKLAGQPVVELFRQGRMARTLLLWLLYFMNFFVTFSLINWLPSIIHASGATMSLALTAIVLLNLGTLAGISTAWLADRFGPPRVAVVTFALGALCVMGIGFSIGSVPTLLALCFLAGLFNNGSTFIANVIATSVYPTAMRTTGVGWSYGIGRLGSIVGPLIAGGMLAASWSLSSVFLVAGMADLMASAAAAGLIMAAPEAFRKAKLAPA